MALVPDEPPDPALADERTYTITELAQASGIAERTIRFYRETGLIDPPRRDGRRAYYSADQLPRVRLIAELREAGLALEAIKELLNDPTTGSPSLATVLHITEELRAPWADDAATRMTEAAVLHTYGRDDPADLELLEANGIIIRNPGRQSVTYHVPSVRRLQLAGQLTRSGVDPEFVFESWRIMEDHLADMSHEIIELFIQYASRDSARDYPNLEADFAELQRLGLATVQLLFAKAVEREIDAFVEQGGVLKIKRQEP